MAEEKDLVKSDTGLGAIKIADEVVSIIAGLAATEIDGIAGMSGGVVGGIAEMLGRKNFSKGVKVEVGERERIERLPVGLRGLRRLGRLFGLRRLLPGGLLGLAGAGLFGLGALAGRVRPFTLCGRDGRFRRDGRLSGRFLRFLFLCLFFRHHSTLNFKLYTLICPALASILASTD